MNLVWKERCPIGSLLRKGASTTNNFGCKLLVPIGLVLRIPLRIEIISDRRISIEIKVTYLIVTLITKLFVIKGY